MVAVTYFLKQTKMENNNIVRNEQMDTLIDCLNHLQTKGFRTQFKAIREGLLSLESMNVFRPEDVEVVHFYRFEGESNPADESILYAIETNNGEKGTLVDGYGNSGDSYASTYMQQVKGLHK